jgi:hypothetical protein
VPLYRIHLAQTVHESLSVDVRADNEEEAEKKALEQSVTMDWRFDEVADREVIAGDIIGP